MVEVHEEQGDGSRSLCRLVVIGEERVEHGIEVTAIAKAGELIGDGLPTALLAEGPDRAHGQDEPDAGQQEGSGREPSESRLVSCRFPTSRTASAHAALSPGMTNDAGS